MAKNLVITIEMLKDAGACGDGLDKIRGVFPNGIVLSAPNIKKAAEIDVDGAYTLAKLLKDTNSEYINYNTVEYEIWRQECRQDECDKANGGAECRERGKRYRIKIYTKFVELYRKENKAPRKPRKKDVSNQE